MKTILLLVHDDEGQESRLQVALDVTRALGAHLTCLDVVVPPLVVTNVYSGAGDAMLLDQAYQRESAHRSTISARLEKEDVAWSMERATGAEGEELLAAADLADLIVVSSRSRAEHIGDARRTASEVMVKADCPVLAVPPECRRLDTGGKALVAWDGSHQANAALKAALPLLKLAESVTLFEVNNPGGEFAMEGAASYLSRNGIHPTLVQHPTRGTVAEAILKRGRDMGAAYLVMGAYGHGRAVEALFGGVTWAILRDSTIPVLLAH